MLTWWWSSHRKLNVSDGKTLILLNSFLLQIIKETFKIFTKIKLLVVIIINCEFIKFVVVMKLERRKKKFSSIRKIV